MEDNQNVEAVEDKNTTDNEQPTNGSTDNNDNDMSLEDYKSALAEARKQAGKYRVERNELKADAEKYRELEKEKLSDLEKLQLEVEESRQNYNTLAQDKAAVELQLQKLELGIKYGITEDNLTLLGNDPELLEDNAKRIASLQEQVNNKSPIPTKKPIENLHSGASVKENKDISYPDGWVVSGPYKR